MLIRRLPLGSVIKEGGQQLKVAAITDSVVLFDGWVGPVPTVYYDDYNAKVSLDDIVSVNVGEGYQWVSDGSWREGDECYVGGRWTSTANTTGQSEGLIYRRKVRLPDRNAEPDPGEGYRLLEQGEMLQEGDEFYNVLEGGQWQKTWLAGMDRASAATYRRKVEEPKRQTTRETTRFKAYPTDPGEGYRWVEVGEPLQEGDELFAFNTWLATSNKLGVPVDGSIAYRRKVEEPSCQSPQCCSTLWDKMPAIPTDFDRARELIGKTVKDEEFGGEFLVVGAYPNGDVQIGALGCAHIDQLFDTYTIVGE